MGFANELLNMNKEMKERTIRAVRFPFLLLHGSADRLIPVSRHRRRCFAVFCLLLRVLLLLLLQRVLLRLLLLLLLLLLLRGCVWPTMLAPPPCARAGDWLL